MINVTHDYSIFKRFFLNRNIRKKNYDNLKEAMQRQPLMHLHPIVVTASYEILDGQHRYEVAKELGLPIHYTKMPDMGLEVLVSVLIDLNYNLSRWGSYEFCELYCKLKKPEYMKFKEFQERFELDIHVAVPLSKERENRKNINNIFRKGEFVFNNQDKIFEIISNGKEFLDVGTSSLLIKNRSKHITTKFFDAYAKLMKFEDFNQEKMIKNLKTVGFSGLVEASNMSSYYNQLLSLYKYRKPGK